MNRIRSFRAAAVEFAVAFCVVFGAAMLAIAVAVLLWVALGIASGRDALAAEPAGEFSPSPSPVHAGKRAVADIPNAQHIRNVGGSDGAGLCVFTSVELAARWQNVAALDGFQAWMKKRPGGGWPEKLDKEIAAFCRSKSVPVPDYVQHTGGDESFLELSLRTGRMPCITYAGRDDFYRTKIAHMVDLVHLDDRDACIVDNNRPGTFVWMSRAELLQRWRDMQGGWGFVLTAPPPPPYAVSPQSFSQCPGGRCPVPQPEPARVNAAPADGWVRFSNAERTWGYWRGGVNTAYYDGARVVAVRGGRVTDEVIEPPAPLPDAPAAVESEANYGIESDKIHAAPRYAVNGVPCDRAAAEKALLDDTGKANVSAVGDAAFLARVRAEFEKLPAEVKLKLNVQYYGPDSWAVGQFGLQPGLTLREPDGPAVDRRAATLGTIPVELFDGERLKNLLLLWKVLKPLLPDLPPLLPTPAPKPTPDPGPPTAFGAELAWLILAAIGLILYWRKGDE